MTTKEALNEAKVHVLAARYEARSAEDIIEWTLATFDSRAAICTSFQAEGMVILDMACRINPDVRVFTIDTGRLPKETYELIDRVREHYGIRIEVHYPDSEDLAQMVSKHGINPFYRSVSLRMLCCEIRKINPLNKALSGLDAWVTGLRRSHSDTRVSTGRIETDEAHGGILKVNPLAGWSDQQVWDYIRANDVPYNELYNRGYTSIGCAPCTRAIQPGEEQRAGRWWWENGIPKECGIHLDLPRQKRQA
jgi:thioredoxin-dependent adenylylsulfate APS reductase